MKTSSRQFWFFLAAVIFLLMEIPAGAQNELREVKVSAPTRLDWEFASSGFGPKAAKLPDGYDSTQQRYHLFVPKDYTGKADKTWPLVAFISPSNQPLGWTAWKKICQQEGILFCSPFAAGNNCPSGQRTRIVLDMLDDVRRNYRIDPDRTYLAGFSGGGRMACAIAFSLPEYFGGVVPICGTNPIVGPTYLRHRIQDRLSVAFVTGETDFNRKENEIYMYPFFQDLGVRSRLWVAAKVGHAISSDKVMAEVQAWLEEDGKRRREDARTRPGLAASPENTPSPIEQAARQVETAQAELRQPQHVWRGVALLQGVTARWPKSPSAARAGKILQEIQQDPKLLQAIAIQGADDEEKSLTAQARAFERFGWKDRAIQAWQILAQNYPEAPIGKKAQAEIKRLRGE